MVGNSDDIQCINPELSFEQQEVDSHIQELIKEVAKNLGISVTEVKEYLGEDFIELLNGAKASDISGLRYEVDEQLFAMGLHRSVTEISLAEQRIHDAEEK